MDSKLPFASKILTNLSFSVFIPSGISIICSLDTNPPFKTVFVASLFTVILSNSSRAESMLIRYLSTEVLSFFSFSKFSESSMLKLPTFFLIKFDKYAPQPNSSPISLHNVLIYVPFEQITSNLTIGFTF